MLLRAIGVTQVAYNLTTLDSFNPQLRTYLGSADRRSRMSRFGLTASEIDPVTVPDGTGGVARESGAPG